MFTCSIFARTLLVQKNDDGLVCISSTVICRAVGAVLNNRELFMNSCHHAIDQGPLYLKGRKQIFSGLNVFHLVSNLDFQGAVTNPAELKPINFYHHLCLQWCFCFNSKWSIFFFLVSNYIDKKLTDNVLLSIILYPGPFQFENITLLFFG